ncbi:MAG: hypothetical protein ACH0QD_09315 [Tepidibacillus sp.]
MFPILYLFQVMIAAILAWYTVYGYAGSPSTGDQLSDWVSFFIAEKQNLFYTFALLYLIMFILSKPTKYAIKILKNRKISMYQWKKWQAISLLLIIFDVYFYLIIEVNVYFFIPFLLFLIVKTFIRKEQGLFQK